MPKTRKLTDLYVVYKDIEIADPKGGSIAVRVQKLNPMDHETAMRRSSAKRAKTLAMARMPEESEERSAYMNQLFDIAKDRDETIDFLAAEHVTNKYSSIEAEVAAEDEWSKGEYIQGLKDEWFAGLDDVYALGAKEEDPEPYLEAERVFKELERFQAAVNKEVEAESERFKKDIDGWSEKKLIDTAVNKLIETHAEMAWLSEFRRMEILLGVRDVKTGKPVFSSRDEVNTLANEVLAELIRAFVELNVDFTEGKD